jgi:hypothetical protein
MKNCIRVGDELTRPLGITGVLDFKHNTVLHRWRGEGLSVELVQLDLVSSHCFTWRQRKIQSLKHVVLGVQHNGHSPQTHYYLAQYTVITTTDKLHDFSFVYLNEIMMVIPSVQSTRWRNSPSRYQHVSLKYKVLRLKKTLLGIVFSLGETSPWLLLMAVRKSET